MELLILGKTNDDKGSQLEQLTRHLLERIGYTDIVVNEIGAGGHEIDVRAEIGIPSLSGEQRHRVICECKAHKTRIRMADWLKFLGKIFVEETRLKKRVNGCFIALSGVNGAVAGNYDMLRENRDGIELITGDDLVRLLSKAFDTIPLREVISRLHTSTARQSTRIALCYYDQRIYWLIEFEGGEFSLLSNEGAILASDGCKDVQLILGNNTDVGRFVDLEAEAEAHRRARFAEKIVLTELMLFGGSGSCEEMLKNWLDTCPDDNWRFFSIDELDGAAKRLAKQRYVEIKESGQFSILLLDEPHKKTEQVVRFFKYLLRDDALIAGIGCSFYDEHIDMALLDKICDIQGGITLSEERKEDSLVLLRWSPGALVWALHPDPMIVVHRKQEPLVDENVEKTDVDYFLGQLLDHFNEDFKKGPLTRYFFSIRDLREVDTRRRVEIKGTVASKLILELRGRLGMGEMAESLGGGVAKVLLLEDSPEPWEWHKTRSDVSNGECNAQNISKDEAGVA